ncbi:MAG: NAD(P)/FAD-dependent oxidoreductase [Succiniclasticum sp.]|nr:NAD(P)/FAD-dependent oxidoreductase [Succiniclasticum sp.]MDY6304284.1 NAD(P)/FAD-dependent oxidoreductase [Succiniclasticum sp.]MDY6345813.1 NAD(P)/FAD-dependent oxidoreductase [Succiniclasticum sp.]
MARILVIGGGPAGISAALYARRGGLDVTVFTKGTGALAKAERIENYYGLPEAVSGEQLNRQGLDGARRIGVDLVEAEVVGVGMDDTWSRFVVSTAAGTWDGDAVILAAGASRIVPPLPGVRELEGRGVSYCAVCDAFFYRQKTVAVLGSGAYALHEAEALLPHAAAVYLLTDGREPDVAVPPSLRVVTDRLASLEGAQDSPARVRAVTFADGRSLSLDGLFIALGTAGSTDLARKMGAQIQGNRVCVDAATMATNVPGLYAAGDCTGGLLQVVKAAYEGALAGLSALKYVRDREKAAQSREGGSHARTDGAD